MGAGTQEGPQTRRERLRAIAEAYTEAIHEPTTKDQLDAAEPVSRYAAVTSEGSPESSYVDYGNLIVADTAEALAEKLRQECGEGWLAYWRVWDLDSPWDTWGNLEASYRVRVGEDATAPVHVVTLAGREAGTYLFDDRLDAEAFADLVHRHGGAARVSEEPLRDHRAADRLMDVEAADPRPIDDGPAASGNWWAYAKLARHVGHRIVCVDYAGGRNVALECEDCGEVLLDHDRPDPPPPAEGPTR
jgi:hypothetical protein